MPAPAPNDETRRGILAAAQRCLLQHGYAGLSTRRVAEDAGVPLSQIHYHFGSKQQLVVALLAALDADLLERQTRMYAEPMPLSERWQKACEYLEHDVRSGYVRVLHELIAASFSDAELAERVRGILKGWLELLTRVAKEAEQELGPLAPFTARELASLVASAFLGAEVALLLDVDARTFPVQRALQKVGALIQKREKEVSR